MRLWLNLYISGNLFFFLLSSKVSHSNSSYLKYRLSLDSFEPCLSLRREIRGFRVVKLLVGIG